MEEADAVSGLLVLTHEVEIERTDVVLALEDPEHPVVIRRIVCEARDAAAVPVCAMLFVVLRIVVDTARDPTSHNLWPFEILQVGVGGLLIVGVLKLLRRFTGAQ